MLRWFSSYLGQEQTQSPQPRFLLSKCIIHHLQPPNPTTAPPTVPHSAAAPRAVPGQPLPSPGPGSRPPSGRPIHPAQAPRTLLFTSMVPRQPLPAPCRWLRFILRPDPARPPQTPPPVGSAGSERAAGGLGTRLRPGRLLIGTCRETAAARVSAQSSVRRAPHTAGPRVGLAARRAGTPLPPSGSRRQERRQRRRGRSRRYRRRSLALHHLPGKLARTRAPDSGRSLGACTRPPAVSVGASVARAPPTPNEKRAPAPEAPTNQYTLGEARGRATFSKIPPISARLVWC